MAASSKSKRKPKTYKFADLRAEATLHSDDEDAPMYPPFVIDDISPPIVITAPDTLERQLVIAEMIDAQGGFTVGQALPLLRALCGTAFPRVWMLIKDDRDPQTAIALVQALVAHMYDAIEGEATSLPGGSVGSSD